jgi:hypothetical protein
MTNEIAQIDAFELFLRIPLKYELGLTHCMQKTCKLQGTFHKNLKFLWIWSAILNSKIVLFIQ